VSFVSVSDYKPSIRTHPPYPAVTHTATMETCMVNATEGESFLCPPAMHPHSLALPSWHTPVHLFQGDRVLGATNSSSPKDTEGFWVKHGQGCCLAGAIPHNGHALAYGKAGAVVGDAICTADDALATHVTALGAVLSHVCKAIACARVSKERGRAHVGGRQLLPPFARTLC